MTFERIIPRVSLYYKLMIPVIFAVILGFALLWRGMQPSPAWSALRFSKLADMNPALWIMIITGMTGFLLGTWIWILRPNNLAAFLFGLSGLATLAFTFSPLLFYAVTPVSQQFGEVLSGINMYGASLFGIAICALMLIYPTRLPFYKLIGPVGAAVFFLWTVLTSFDVENVGYHVQIITLTEMLCIVALSVWQIIASQNEADKRAIAIWLAACVVIGSGPFIALVAAPSSFGRDVILPPHIAFGFFNILYIGFAIGLLRFRLFDLGGWAFQMFFHAGLAVLFIIVDLVLVSSLAVESSTALTLTALFLALLYLPFRGWLWERFSGQKKINKTEMFQSVLETGLKPSGEARAQSWLSLLRRTFKPVEISQGPLQTSQVSVSHDGQSLTLPAANNAPALELHQKYEGRSLFNTHDKELATQLLTLITQIDGSRQAYDRGVNEERSRIGKDIHDNIGGQLLQALRADKPRRKDEMIRESLSELRDVINNAALSDMPLSDTLADLRAETAERAESQNIELSWQVDDFDRAEITVDRVHAFRSVLREAVSNVLKHANADRLIIEIKKLEKEIVLTIKDNGKGLQQGEKSADPNGGHGLKNMRERVEKLNGDFSIKSNKHGTHVKAKFQMADTP